MSNEAFSSIIALSIIGGYVGIAILWGSFLYHLYLYKTKAFEKIGKNVMDWQIRLANLFEIRTKEEWATYLKEHNKRSDEDQGFIFGGAMWPLYLLYILCILIIAPFKFWSRANISRNLRRTERKHRKKKFREIQNLIKLEAKKRTIEWLKKEYPEASNGGKTSDLLVEDQFSKIYEELKWTYPKDILNDDDLKIYEECLMEEI